MLISWRVTIPNRARSQNCQGIFPFMSTKIRRRTAMTMCLSVDEGRVGGGPTKRDTGKKNLLGGGNSNILEFSPRKLGKMNPFYFDEHVFLTERDAGSVGFLHLLFFHVFSLFSFPPFHMSKKSRKTNKKQKKQSCEKNLG